MTTYPWDDDPPALLTKRELCEIVGFVPKQVDSFVRDGMPSVAGPSSRSPTKFVLKDCVAWLVQRRETPDDPLTKLAPRRTPKRPPSSKGSMPSLTAT